MPACSRRMRTTRAIGSSLRDKLMSLLCRLSFYANPQPDPASVGRSCAISPIAAPTRILDNLSPLRIVGFTRKQRVVGRRIRFDPEANFWANARRTPQSTTPSPHFTRQPS
jgi:hypothetical protein